MAWGSLSKRERALVAIALLAAVGVGGYLYVLEPLRQRSRQASELIPAREAKLERRHQLIAQRATLAAELAEADRRLIGQSSRLLQGPTAPLAASELQKLVKDLAAEVGVDVRSERVLPTADRNGLVEVPIEITVAGGIRESVNLLYQIDRTPKLLTLQDLKVRVVSTGQARDLLTTLTVSGYLMGGPPTGKAAEKASTEQGKARPPRG